MSTSPSKPCREKRNKAAIQEHERFLDRHRLELLRYLDGVAPGAAEEPDAPGFVETVLTAWLERFGRAELADPTPEERTFWFALYQLEELVERPGPHVDPYEKLMMEHLIEARESLRQRRALPEHRFMATRPDGA